MLDRPTLLEGGGGEGGGISKLSRHPRGSSGIPPSKNTLLEYIHHGFLGWQRFSVPRPYCRDFCASERDKGEVPSRHVWDDVFLQLEVHVDQVIAGVAISKNRETFAVSWTITRATLGPPPSMLPALHTTSKTGMQGVVHITHRPTPIFVLLD